MKRRRKKASDILRETQYVFSRKVPFREAFPEIKSVRVRTEESGYSPSGMYFSKPSVTEYNENSLGEYIDCSNPLCYGGGFSIGQILREMVDKKQTHNETFEPCRGYEGSPKGRRRYRSCVNSWKVTVDIEYFTEKEMEELAKKSEKA